MHSAPLTHSTISSVPLCSSPKETARAVTANPGTIWWQGWGPEASLTFPLLQNQQCKTNSYPLICFSPRNSVHSWASAHLLLNFLIIRNGQSAHSNLLSRLPDRIDSVSWRSWKRLSIGPYTWTVTAQSGSGEWIPYDCSLVPWNLIVFQPATYHITYGSSSKSEMRKHYWVQKDTEI